MTTPQPSTRFSYEYGSFSLDDPQSGTGMWRWRALLPLDGSDAYPLSVGGTPLVKPRRLGAALGIPDLLLKDETLGPSGSNKDRATALCLVDALRQGSQVVSCASTGNVAGSLAVGASAVGVEACIFMSAASAAFDKMRFTRAFGATVILVEGTYEDAYQLSHEACEYFGWYERNTASNPLCVQAKKTVAFEVWEQLGQRLPDVVVIPVGDGVTIAAFELGCQELVRCGVTDRIPRLVGVQATGAAPLASAFHEERDEWEATTADTIADGIAVGSPFFGNEALAAVRRTDGEFVTVTDQDMQDAIDLLASSAGILAEPAGSAAVAGAGAWARRHGRVNETVVALVTGTGLKDQRWLPDTGRTLRATHIDDIEEAVVAPSQK